MSLLDELQSSLSKYNLVVSLVSGALLTACGWLFTWWRRNRETKPFLSITSDTNHIVLTNHGIHSVELLTANLTLRDISSKPELAKEHNVLLGVTGLVGPGEARKLTEISGSITDAVSEIWEPTRRHIEQLGWSPNQPALISCKIHLSCGVLGKRRRHSLAFSRHLSGSPAVGWHIQRSPYDPDYPDPISERLHHWARTTWKWIRHPRQAYRARQQFNFLGEQLAVHGLLKAMHEQTISTEQGLRSLEKLARKASVDVVTLIGRHVELPEDFDLDEIRLAIASEMKD